MRPELRERILAYNEQRAKEKERANDFQTLLDSLPPGLRLLLLKDKICGAILEKYGIGK